MQDNPQPPAPRNSYCEFFLFSEKPFELTPDPDFLFLGRAYREALAALLYGIRERRGVVCLIGEVGVGKTTLLNALRVRLGEETKVAFVSNTGLDFEQMLRGILKDLGLAGPAEQVSSAGALRKIGALALESLASGRNVVVVVDEAQNLDTPALENLRLLSNLETSKHKLVQIVLSGQPELDVKLRQPNLRQLDQRISVRRYLTPLSEKETYEYVQDRLISANYRGPTLFSRRALKLLREHTGGIPRTINILCEDALMTAYASQKRKVKVAVMEEVIRSRTWSPFSWEGVAREGEKAASKEKGPWTAVVFLAGLCILLYLGLQVIHLPFMTTGEEGGTLLSGEKSGISSHQGPFSVTLPDAFGRSGGENNPPGSGATPAPSPPRDSGTHCPPSESLLFAVQMGAFRDIKYAEDLVKALNMRGYDTRVVYEKGLHRVWIKEGFQRADAVRVVERLAREGFARGFIRRQKEDPNHE